jgi:hypothetical protein
MTVLKICLSAAMKNIYLVNAVLPALWRKKKKSGVIIALRFMAGGRLCVHLNLILPALDDDRARAWNQKRNEQSFIKEGMQR